MFITLCLNTLQELNFEKRANTCSLIFNEKFVYRISHSPLQQLVAYVSFLLFQVFYSQQFFFFFYLHLKRSILRKFHVSKYGGLCQELMNKSVTFASYNLYYITYTKLINIQTTMQISMQIQIFENTIKKIELRQIIILSVKYYRKLYDTLYLSLYYIQSFMQIQIFENTMKKVQLGQKIILYPSSIIKSAVIFAYSVSFPVS